MKKILCRIAICVLACSASLAFAQDFIGATYDLTPDGTNQAALCGNLWGSAPQTYTLDGSTLSSINVGYADGHVETHNRIAIQWQFTGNGGAESYFY